MSTPAAFPPLKHIFVLMLENRAFDHMLGFSGITGTDAVSGQPAAIDGLNGAEENLFATRTYRVSRPADWAIEVDPGHEFPDVLCQMCGPGATYPPGGIYPPIGNTGFAASFAAACASAGKPSDPGGILRCYSPEQLPVLVALAREFALCDHWHASMPGPTWPNRLFAHAATSAGLDHSPSTAEILLWESVDGFAFKNGTVFDRLRARGVQWRIYAGEDFPMAASLKGVHLDDTRPYSFFERDLAAGEYPYGYTFIEPSYRVLEDYKCGTSQHPLDDVTRGERLIQTTYEAIRNSPVWDGSLLIVTWDEHGGFYDHSIPPGAAAPGDTAPGSEHNRYGFTFEQLGPRVPAVIVSPWIPRNRIDRRVYDHSSIPATLESLFGLSAMTARDRAANSLLPLLSLGEPRADCPANLPGPAASGIGGCPPVDPPPASPGTRVRNAKAADAVSRPADSIDDGNLPVIVHAAVRQDLELSPPSRRAAILARAGALRSRSDAARYMAGVKRKLSRARPAP